MTTESDSYLFDLIPTQYANGPSGPFAYRRGGPRGQVPLVLCNRFRGTIDHWDPAFLDVLATERDVIVFDAPGVGSSGGEAPATVQEMAQDTLEFVSLLGLRQVDLLGWSMGGFVAQAATLTQPQLVRRLIVAGSKPGPVPAAPQSPPKVGQVAGKPVNDDEDFLYLFFPDTPQGRAAGQASLRRLETRHGGGAGGTEVDAVASKAQTRALVAWSSGQDSAWERLEELTLPVLVAGGAHDLLMDAYHSFAMVRRLPDATLVLYSDAGHAFLFQHAEVFGRQVLDFLR
ncbi:alpha/beta fold hydrolase [Streptacidiphilus sp. P02-A3a]|uniref:alpha/beta fold hydrolase n=1 Tax=Streptacidiphilus sp. P02-A3a TaxID=2704468 RepID=UPI0015FC9FE2|nr:alpha/beta hydrolase [Streptacidiphilus sp. P02-A3a]QMU73055.1 alpha/beta hydrolase [Streptacidiphilus sp. P02-A3a]